MQHPSFGMIPPQEGFNRQNLLRSNVDDRLIRNVELAALKSPSQVGLMLQPFQPLLVDVRIEYSEYSSSVGFGSVEGNIRST